MPIDKLIGRLYPVFGVLLIVMAAVSITYILTAKEGFRLSQGFACAAGACASLLLLAVYLTRLAKQLKMKT